MKSVTKILALSAAVALMLAAACDLKNTETNRTDLIPSLDATVINYRSQNFVMPGDIEIGRDFPAGTIPSRTARIAPVIVTISRGGYDVVDIEHASITLRMVLQPVGYRGAAGLTLYVGNGVDIYNDPSAVSVKKKDFIPDTLEVVTAQERLRSILAMGEVVFGMEFELSPTRLDTGTIAIQGHVEKFEAEIKGVQGIF